MKRKILSLFLVICIVLSAFTVLSSCSEDETPQETEKQETEKSETKAPETDAPTTDAPTTDAPVTDAPTTDAPTTDAPATDAPTTDAPTTDAPATDAPATDAPATDAPATDAPATDAPATDAPTLPQKLSAPAVTLTGNVASWESDPEADKFEYSLDGNLFYAENTVTSKMLTNGQSFKIRAVGNGITNLTSDWSNTVVYSESVIVPTPQPTKLGVPVITVSDSGVASWNAVPNASSYLYKINGGAEVPTTATSVQLSDGQSIVVKAVGDGTNYTDGDYSTSQIYEASAPNLTKAPTYLGIMASAQEPTSGNIPSEIALLPLYSGAKGISLDEALKNYLSDGNNSLGDTVPSASDYKLYSSVGNTVYIQIWLDNPDQNTILSLKLNGTKYQSGGALQSFFVADGDSYLNCVYVAVTVPNNSYGHIDYEVTEIEYVEGTNISQDGKAVLIDENNDTVSIGLPYEQSVPTVTFSNESSTATSVSLLVNVADASGFTDTVGGWLRVIIYNRNNEILAQQKLANGDNAVTFDNLSADTEYGVMVFIFGDIHDGNGVSVHSLSNQTYRTENVITATVISDILQNGQTGKYYPNINVEAQLGDATFTFTRVEVCDWAGEVYYTGEFNGSANITEGILNGQSYVIKIYYENASGVEQSYKTDVYVERMDYPWVLEPCLRYGLIDDAVLGFDFGDNKSNFDNLTIKIIDEYSKQYIAEDAIALINNPNLIDELNERLSGLDRGDENSGYFELGLQINRLERALDIMEEYYSDMTLQDWQTELEKGIYVYEYVFGEDEQFFKVGNKYYVVLDGYQSQRVNDSSQKYILSADFDLNDGMGVEEDRTIAEGLFDINAAIGKNDYLFAEEFTLGEDNAVYLEVKSRNNLGDESYRELGYVNQIVLADGYDVLQVLWTQDEPEHAIDEAAWMEDIIEALKSGEDVESVFPLGELSPISFDLDGIQFDSSLVGNYYIRFTYKMYGKEYTDEHPYDWDGGVIDYTVKGVLPQVTVEFSNSVEDFGRWSISSPDWVKNGIWNFSYTVEIRDADQNLVDEAELGQYQERLPLNYSIRIRLDSYIGGDYYTQGEWSDWFTCLPIVLSVPEGFAQSYESDGVKVEWLWVDGVEKYVYTVNGGEEQETDEAVISGLKNGDKVKVKAVPASDSNYVESAYSEVYTVIDTRTQLGTPTNIRAEAKVLTWDSVEGASYYEIEFIQGDTLHVQRTDYSEYGPATVGRTYRVRACNDDVENYKVSEWSAEFTYTVTLEAPTFNRIRSERVYWNSVDYAEGYNYKIGEDGDVSDNGRTVYIALSKIPVGEKLYVQAYASGCESTEWVMIYHNVTKLATPSVTVSGGIASWGAIENAKGYIYKINGGEEKLTAELSVSGLSAGDTVTVCATTDEAAYVNSDWSEIKTQLPVMSAPVLDTSFFASEGRISWSTVEGATDYEYDLDGEISTVLETSIENIQYEQSFKVRAICENGEYERYGEWTELIVREDLREQLATPVIAYDPEIGLTVAINDPNVSYYEVMFGQDGHKTLYYPPDGAYETEVITNSFAFPENDYTVYVKAVSEDGSYRDSEWATLTISFE